MRSLYFIILKSIKHACFFRGIKSTQAEVMLFSLTNVHFITGVHICQCHLFCLKCCSFLNVYVGSIWTHLCKLWVLLHGHRHSTHTLTCSAWSIAHISWEQQLRKTPSLAFLHKSSLPFPCLQGASITQLHFTGSSYSNHCAFPLAYTEYRIHGLHFHCCHKCV